MRVAFLGTADFAIPALEALLGSSHQLVGVVTGPDKPAGRGRTLRPTPVAHWLSESGYEGPILKPRKLRSDSFAADFAALAADVAVVVAYRILPPTIFDMPEHGTLNIHPSDLPRYRGPAPIHWAVINGDRQTRVSLIRITERVDAGGVVLKSDPVEIGFRETAGELHDRLAPLGGELALEALRRLAGGEPLEPQPQDEGLVTRAPKLSKEDGFISFREEAAQLHNRVRGLTPWPGAWTRLVGDRTLKLFDSKPVELPSAESEGSAGKVLGLKHPGEEGRLTVLAVDGAVSFGELQPEGERRMTPSEFINGLQNSDLMVDDLRLGGGS